MRVGRRHFVTKVIKFDFLSNMPILDEEDDGIGWSVINRAYYIKQLLIEFSIGKIGSLLGVGPKIITDFGFDILCWNNYT
jgi:hypothetical protein